MEGRSIKVWPCLEVNGFICIWQHSKGEINNILFFTSFKEIFLIGKSPEWFPDSLDSGENFSGGIEYILTTSIGNNSIVSFLMHGAFTFCLTGKRSFIFR